MDRLSRNICLGAGLAAAGVVLALAVAFAFERPPAPVNVAGAEARPWSPPPAPTPEAHVSVPTVTRPIAVHRVPQPPARVTPVSFPAPKAVAVLPSPSGDPPAEQPQARFAAFPSGQAVPIDLGAVGSLNGRFSHREVDDQLRDWLVFAVASEAGLSPDALNRVLFDLPVVREGYMRAGANFEYDVTRAFYPGDGSVVALLPHCADAEARDHLARIADEFRKTTGKRPAEAVVFEYWLAPGRRAATVTRRASVADEALFSAAYGYRERQVRDADDLRAFLAEVDDPTFASHAGGTLTLGGRKHAARPYRGLTYADIAAVWQAQRGLVRQRRDILARWRDEEKQLDDAWQGELDRLNASFKERGKELHRAANDQLRERIEQLETAMKAEIANLPGPEEPGIGGLPGLPPGLDDNPLMLNERLLREQLLEDPRLKEQLLRNYLERGVDTPGSGLRRRRRNPLLDGLGGGGIPVGRTPRVPRRGLPQGDLDEIQAKYKRQAEWVKNEVEAGYKRQIAENGREYEAKAAKIQAGHDSAVRELFRRQQEELSDLHLPDRIGFSLDPIYDFEALGAWFARSGAPAVLAFAKEHPGVVPDDQVEAARRGIAARNPEALMNLLGRLKDSGDKDGEKLSEFLFHQTRWLTFQQARYDGGDRDGTRGLDGTEVGMTLFYCDLLAKLWAGLDFERSAPKRDIPDFRSMHDGGIAAIFRKQAESQPDTRLWFGPEDRAFQLTDRKQTLVLAWNAAQVFALGSDPRLGVEIPPGPHVEASLGWFNDHYEEIARHEPQYQKLSSFMKWSLVASWLVAQEKEGMLSFLDGEPVEHKQWFPDWVKAHPELRFKSWDRIGFHERGYKGAPAESLPTLYSSSFYNYGDSDNPLLRQRLSGGVGAPNPETIRLRAALPELADLSVLTAPGINPASLAGRGSLEHFRGTLYEFAGGDGVARLVVTPRFRLQLAGDLASLAGKDPQQVLERLARTGVDITGATVRGNEVLLAARMFGRDAEFAVPRLTRTVTVRPGGLLTLDAQAASEPLATLRVERRSGGLAVAFQGRDVARAQELALAASRPGWRPAMLADHPSVEMPILLNDRTALAKLRGTDKWVKIEPETKPAAKLAASWGARVSDTVAGSHGQLVAWVDGARITEVLQGAEYLRVELPRDLALRPVASVSPRGPPAEALRLSLAASGGSEARALEVVFDPSGRALYVPVKEVQARLGANLHHLDRWLSPANLKAIEGAAGGRGGKDLILKIELPEPPPRLDDTLLAKLAAGDGTAADLIARDPERARELLDWHLADGRRRLGRLLTSGRTADVERLAEELRLVHGERLALDPAVEGYLSRLADYRSLVRGLPEEPWVKADLWERHIRELGARAGRASDPSSAAAEMDRFLAELRHLCERAPWFRSPQVARPEFGEDGIVRLRFGDQPPMALDSPSLSGRPVLVDMVGQEARLKDVVDQAKQIEARNPGYEFTFKVTVDGEARYRRLPDMEPVRLFGDRDGLSEQPDGIREVITDWLKSLAWEWDGQRMRFSLPGNVQLVVDHFGADGGAINRLAARIGTKQFQGQHLITLICDTCDFEALARVGTKALKEGGALSVCFPMSKKVLQSRVAPLVVEELIQPTPGLSSSVPSLTQSEMVGRAFLRVSEGLDRCLKADDLARALRQEFPSLRMRGRLKVFEGKDGLSRDLIKEMSEQLKAQARGMVPLVHNAGPGMLGRVSC
jgi:hypothetical protein